MHQTKHPFVRGAKYCVQRGFFSNTLKKELIVSLYFPEGQ